MPAEPQRPHVYHVAPRRYVWIWFTFGPLALVFLGAGAFSQAPANGPDDRGGYLFGGAMLLAVTLFIHFLVRWARLELSEKGVRLRQAGYRLEAPWAEVIGMRLDRGHEAFVTSRPVGGKGAGLLALAGGATAPIPILTLYDADQQALLREHRLIPIEAFAWYLRHGRLRADLECFAPHLRTVLATLDAPTPARSSAASPPPARQPPQAAGTARQWLTFLVILLAIFGVLAFAFSSRPHEQIVRQMATIAFPAVFAVQFGFGARSCFRIGSWLAGSGLALVAILLGLWAFAGASKGADRLGVSHAFNQVFATLFFAFVALGMALASRNAFRRHSPALGAVLLIGALFLTLCAVLAGLDFARPH